MFDWKKRINSYLEADKLADDRKSEEREKASKEQELKCRQNQLIELGKKFKCHVCQKSAARPRQYNIGTSEPFTNDPAFAWHDDWSEPGDLLQCSRCHKWTCNDCLHKDICKSCADKLP